MSKQSIYDAICENLNSEGKLSQNFKLPFKQTSPNELSFMPGAKDGIGIFHFSLKNPETVSKKIVKFLKSDWKKGNTNSQKKIAESLVNGKVLLIEGGEYRLCEGLGNGCGRGCHRNRHGRRFASGK